MIRIIKLKLAIRNILRNSLRSIVSITVIASSIISIVIFRGFAQNTLGTVKHIASENQFGHIQIAMKKYWSPGSETKKARLLDLKVLNPLKELIPSIDRISGRLSFYGLISANDVSSTGFFMGIDLESEVNFSQSMEIIKGSYFSTNQSDEVLIGTLLAQQLNVSAGDTITVLCTTVDGMTNALDLIVKGVFTARIDEIDSKVIYLPLKLAQKLIDTINVDLAVVKFKKVELAELHVSQLKHELTKIDSNLTFRTWRDLSSLFRQTVKFYKVQNLIVEAMILLLMFLGITNSVSMSVNERTAEIGTLRALGESRFSIISQFLLENALISALGSVLGILLSYFLIKTIHWMNIITAFPGASTPFQIKITFMYYAVLYGMFITVTTTFIATFVSAYASTKLSIIDSLRKNI